MSEQKTALSGEQGCAGCAALEKLYREIDARETAVLAALVHEGDTVLLNRITKRSIELREPCMALRKMVQDEILRHACSHVSAVPKEPQP